MLKVDVVLIIEYVFRRLGMEVFNVEKLRKMVADDPAVWDIYANGLTIGVNQCEKPATIEKLKRYKPKNVSELAAFIAAIRPGFKSMYGKFESREPFSYGIPALDSLIQTEEIKDSYILFQENLMTILHYASFAMSETYGAVKNIAKKKADKVKVLKDKFESGCTERIVEDEHVTEEEARLVSDRIWRIINDSCSYLFNACLSGDTVMFRDNTGYTPLTIEEMYNIRNDTPYAKQTGHKNLHSKYVSYGYGNAYSMRTDEGNIVKRNKIVDIRTAGVRDTYRVTLESGISVVATLNHKFPTPDGEKHLSDLSLGDMLYVKDKYKKSDFDASFTDGTFEKNIPKKGQMGFQKKENGASVKFNAFRKEHVLLKCACESCGRPYSEDCRFEVHHKDGNRKNNDYDNYQWLCVSCHKKIHYSEFNRTTQGGKGYTTHLEKITSIEFEKTQMTYDVEMADPYHNFVLDNGMVVSNSHAYCMALDSLYCAYLKAHYPYEFYEVLLQFYSDKGNKDKVRLIKQEMKAFGISEGPYRFGVDNRKFKADKDHHQIIPSLLSIKSLSQKCADVMYKLGQQQWPTFLHLYRKSQEEGVNTKQLDILIKIGYFCQFGTQKQLDQMVEMLELLGWEERKSIDIGKVPDKFRSTVRPYVDDKGDFLPLENIDITAIRDQKDAALNAIVTEMKSTYKTKKASLELIKSNADLPAVHRYYDTKRHYDNLIANAQDKLAQSQRERGLQCLLEICESILANPEDYKAAENIQREFNCLGYLANDYSKYNSSYGIVSTIDDKYVTRKVTIYRICDGETTVYKIFAKTWEELPLMEGDIIRIKEARQDYRRMKDETGHWVPTKELEWILKGYDVFRKTS